jgi:hypothetical protein
MPYLQPIQRPTHPPSLVAIPGHCSPEPPQGDLQPYGLGLVAEPTPDGPDFHRFCDLHAWASLPAATPDSTGRCPWCAVSLDNRRGLARFARLKARMGAGGLR